MSSGGPLSSVPPQLPCRSLGTDFRYVRARSRQTVEIPRPLRTSTSTGDDAFDHAVVQAKVLDLMVECLPEGNSVGAEGASASVSGIRATAGELSLASWRVCVCVCVARLTMDRVFHRSAHLNLLAGVEHRGLHGLALARSRARIAEQIVSKCLGFVFHVVAGLQELGGIDASSVPEH